MEIEMIETTEMPKNCPMKYIFIITHNKKFIIKYKNEIKVQEVISALPDINADKLIPEKKYNEKDILNSDQYVQSGTSYYVFDKVRFRIFEWLCCL
jgi:hypothetical protein